MSRTSSYSFELKLQIVEQLLSGNMTITQASRASGVDRATIRAWRNLYLSEGASALSVQKKNRTYSEEMKRNAVRDYMEKKASLSEITEKYHLRSKTQLRNWIKRFHTDGMMRDTEERGSEQNQIVLK